MNLEKLEVQRRRCRVCEDWIKKGDLYWLVDEATTRYGGMRYSCVCIKCIVKAALLVPNFKEIQKRIIAELL